MTNIKKGLLIIAPIVLLSITLFGEYGVSQEDNSKKKNNQGKDKENKIAAFKITMPEKFDLPLVESRAQGYPQNVESIMKGIHKTNGPFTCVELIWDKKGETYIKNIRLLIYVGVDKEHAKQISEWYRNSIAAMAFPCKKVVGDECWLDGELFRFKNYLINGHFGIKQVDNHQLDKEIIENIEQGKGKNEVIWIGNPKGQIEPWKKQKDTFVKGGGECREDKEGHKYGHVCMRTKEEPNGFYKYTITSGVIVSGACVGWIKPGVKDEKISIIVPNNDFYYVNSSGEYEIEVGRGNSEKKMEDVFKVKVTIQ